MFFLYFIIAIPVLQRVWHHSPKIKLRPVHICIIVKIPRHGHTNLSSKYHLNHPAEERQNFPFLLITSPQSNPAGSARVNNCEVPAALSAACYRKACGRDREQFTARQEISSWTDWGSYNMWCLFAKQTQQAHKRESPYAIGQLPIFTQALLDASRTSV